MNHTFRSILILGVLITFTNAAWADGSDNFYTVSRKSGYRDIEKDGWIFKNVTAAKPNNDSIFDAFYITMTGKRSLASSITSPKIPGGLDSLIFEYGMSCLDKKILANLTITVFHANGTTSTLKNINIGYFCPYSDEHICRGWRDKYEMGFIGQTLPSDTVQFKWENLSPSYKDEHIDRMAIWNVRWRSATPIPGPCDVNTITDESIEE